VTIFCNVLFAKHQKLSYLQTKAHIDKMYGKMLTFPSKNCMCV